MYRPCRVDKNQPEIVEEFRQLGCSVEYTHFYADGFPDILVGIWGFNILVEIKDGKKPPSARKLTKFQGWWHLAWQGQVVVIKSIDEVRDVVASLRKFKKELQQKNIELPCVFSVKKSS